MNFTDLFIRRPVLATVLSLLIVVLGLRAYNGLSLRQYPEISYPIVHVMTLYPGANAELIQGFITRPLQRAIATAEGIDYIEASSDDGMSRISAHLRAGYDIDTAFADIGAKVEQERKQLPREAEDPVIEKEAGYGQDTLFYLSFTSEVLSPEQITDYLDRVVQPVLSTVAGVGKVVTHGERNFAMRIWLDPGRLAAFGLAAEDVRDAISRNNLLSSAGTLRSNLIKYYVNPMTTLPDETAFRQLVVKREGASIVRLADVARVELGAENYDRQVSDSGRRAVFVEVDAGVNANPLEVGDAVKTIMPRIVSQLPDGLNADIVFDATTSIKQSINEVRITLVEASAIVIAVIFLFLGSLRSVIIPVITIPLSLIGVISVMLWFGFSVNLLTLLAMVLAIGLVVDDAIVVVENIQRHIEEGLPPAEASLVGAREIAFPVIAMTLTLAAVYAPIGFLGGLTGKLFIEFAFTLAGAVVVSGLIALTLSPMMCARLLRRESARGGFVHFIDSRFEALKERYRGLLRRTLANRPVVVLFAAAVFTSIFFLYRAIPQELAPLEDSGEVFIMGETPLNSTIDFVARQAEHAQQIIDGLPERKRNFLISGAEPLNTFFGMVMLKPWSERERSASEIRQDLEAQFAAVSGARIQALTFPSIPGASADLPIKFVINTTGSYELLQQVADEIEAKARASGRFIYVNSSLAFEKPELRVDIDRDKAARLGIEMPQVAAALSSFLGENESSRFSIDSRSYKVILQAEGRDRAAPADLAGFQLRTATGELVPLSAIASWTRVNRPNKLAEFQQLNASTIGALPMPGLSIGQGIEWFETEARGMLPEGFSADHVGQSRQFLAEGNKLLLTFVFSFVVIFLVLAAQFESFSDPLTVLVSVPLSVCGALIPLALGAGTMNIYTQVGLLTLIGLISKHGILIVDFANRHREATGADVFEAVIEAATVRLRPILMTTAAMIFGVLPLLLATGAGAQARINIGIVITAGMAIGTLFTLFVLPVVYTFVSGSHARRV